MFVGDILDFPSAFLLDVANRRELNILLLQEAAEVVATATTDADSADNDPFTRRNSAVEAKC